MRDTIEAHLPTPWLRSPWLAAGIAGLAAIAAGVLNALLFELVVGGLAMVAIVYLAWHAHPVWPVSLGLAATVFSSHWGQLGFPLPLDRLLLGVGLAGVIFRASASKRREPFRFGFPAIFLVLAILWTLGSAITVGTITNTTAMYSLLDRIGIVPLLLLLCAPAVFRGRRQVNIFLATMVGLGLYLGTTALLEALKLKALIWPHYITDPTIGLHIERARGPFAEAVGNGLALYACAVFGAMGFMLWTAKRPRALAAASTLLCTAGILFTVTRSIWLSSAVATMIVMAAAKELRRYLVPVAVGAAILVVALLTFVPGLSGTAQNRAANQLPVWDRQNLATAAVNMIDERPLTGFGWGVFPERSIAYFRQGADYPMRGWGLVAHDTYLSNASEIGLIGTTLWLGALISGVVVALGRRGPPWVRPWRFGLLAIAISFAVVAGFVVIVYPFPNYLVWACIGIVIANTLDPEEEPAETSGALS